MGDLFCARMTQQLQGIDVTTNKKGFLECEGEVLELLPAGTFRIRFSNGYEILAHLAGKMRLHRINLLPGDHVIVEMSPYDLTKGRVTRRR